MLVFVRVYPVRLRVIPGRLCMSDMCLWLVFKVHTSREVATTRPGTSRTTRSKQSSAVPTTFVWVLIQGRKPEYLSRAARIPRFHCTSRRSKWRYLFRCTAWAIADGINLGALQSFITPSVLHERRPFHGQQFQELSAIFIDCQQFMISQSVLFVFIEILRSPTHITRVVSETLLCSH